MAGAGYKLFNTGDVLTAAQVNTYLQEQAVMRFANAAARTTALASVLAEGMVSYLQDTDAVEVYNGTAWVGVATGDITAVTAGTGISGGGTSGAVTITNSMATEITAAGDIIVGTGSGTFDNLPIGTTGQVLTADTTVSPYKVKWATPGGGSGLTLISNTSLSAATTNINNVFSSTYENYLLVLNVTNMSLGANIRFRLRASGTDTTTNYGMQLVQTYQSTLNGQESTVTDYWQFGNADPTQCFMVVELARPNVAANTFAISHSITGLSGTFNDLLSEWYGAVQKSSTQFDGITIYSHNSATITGNMRIYGRADS